VVEFGDRLPHVRESLMAFLAEVAGDQSGSVFATGRLAAGFDPVMASNASANDCAVIDCGRLPARNFVAIIALSCRNDVGSRLTVKSGLAGAVMAGFAGA